MAIKNKPVIAPGSINDFCDKGIVFSLCALIFVLPASIALLDSFAGLAVFFYLLKKINRIFVDWPSKTSGLDLLSKFRFIWKSFAPPVNFLNTPLKILSIAVFISVLFSQYPSLSLFAFFGKFIKVVFLYFSFIEAFNDEKRIWTFLSFFMASAFITCLSGVVQHYTGRDFIKGHLIGYENFISTERISSSFFGANGFGVYLLPVIGLMAHLLFTSITQKTSWVMRVGLFLLLVLFFSCLCWTYSRSAWVGLLVLLFVMWVMDRRKLLYAICLFLIFIFTFLPSLNQVRNKSLLNDNSSGQRVKNVTLIQSIKPSEDVGSGRFEYWKKAISIIRTSPVYGTGLNTYARVVKRDPNHSLWRYAHNCYLQMTAETGLLGLGCFLWLVFFLLWQGFKTSNQIKDRWLLSTLQGSVTGLIGFLVQCFFDNTLYSVQLGVLFWVVIGLLVSVTRLKPARNF